MVNTVIEEKLKSVYHKAIRSNGCGYGREANKERQNEEEFEHGDVDSALHVEEDQEIEKPTSETERNNHRSFESVPNEEEGEHD
jgi:hypothetical protein